MRKILKTIAIMLGVICLTIIISWGISVMPIWTRAIVFIVCLIITTIHIYNHINKN